MENEIYKGYRQSDEKNASYWGNPAFFLVLGYCCYLLYYHAGSFSLLEMAISCAVGFVIGFTIADMSSGILHWGADNYFNNDTPVIGKSVVGPFRYHHVDPMSIHNHGWFETNDSTMGVTSVLCIMFVVPLGTLHIIFPIITMTGLIFGGLSNQWHKWAHTRYPPFPAKLLQKTGLILSFEKHSKHHIAPHSVANTISSGFLNPLLDRIGFWRSIENLIENLTGVEPEWKIISRNMVELEKNTVP